MVEFERMYEAYVNCAKKKQLTTTCLQFSFGCLSENIYKIVEDINNRNYVYGESTAFVITYPTPREIYASQFRDRIIQHFFVEEIEPCLNEVLTLNTTSCRKHMGTSRALSLLNKQMQSLSQNGTKDCYYLKIDLSGYFTSINRQIITDLMIDLINTKYYGKYKDDLLYLAPIIYMDNPASHCIRRCDESKWNLVPKRKQLQVDSILGLAIGNITAQHGSNLNLNGLDHYCIDDLGFPNYVRYVDDIIIQCEEKQRLFNAQPLIENKLSETNQTLNRKKTIIDTCYHGVKFLGKITYPYGYQKFTKETKGRTLKQAREMIIDENLLSRLNSSMGRFYYYASYNLCQDFLKELPKEVWDYVEFDELNMKFIKGVNYGNLRNSY